MAVGVKVGDSWNIICLFSICLKCGDTHTHTSIHLSIHPLVPSLNTCHCQNCGRLQPGAKNQDSVWLSILVVRDPGIWTIICCLLGCMSAGGWTRSREASTDMECGHLKWQLKQLCQTSAPRFFFKYCYGKYQEICMEIVAELTAVSLWQVWGWMDRWKLYF